MSIRLLLIIQNAAGGVRTPKQWKRERRRRWNFYTGDDGRWCARDAADKAGRRARSSHSNSRGILDAKQIGYVLWTHATAVGSGALS